VVIGAVLVSACGLVDLSTLSVATVPAKADEVLASGTVLSVAFPVEVDHLAAEQALRVSSNGQTVSGDLSWEGNTLSLVPVPALKPGLRYVLDLNGPIIAADRRSFPLRVSLPFYSQSDGMPPGIDAYSPEAGADLAVDGALVVEFDRAMDQELFKANFSLSPATAFELAWNEEGRKVSVTPKTQWQSCTIYSWILAAKAADANGIAIGEETRHSFVTQADSTSPTVKSWCVVTATSQTAGTAWQKLSDKPEDFRNGDALRFDFSEELDPDSLAAAFQVKPSLRGHLVAWDKDDSSSWLWLPDEDVAPDGSWEISWGTGVKDLAGNSMAAVWKADFEPGIRSAKLLSMTLERDDGSPALKITNFKRGTDSWTFAPRSPENSIRIILEFDQPLALADRSACLAWFGCARWFPDLAEVTSPKLCSLGFPDSRRVSLRYEGFSVGQAATATQAALRHYFKITVTGGNSGIRLGDDQHLAEDQWLVFSTN
jgi:hypothetical protein